MVGPKVSQHTLQQTFLPNDTKYHLLYTTEKKRCGRKNTILKSFIYFSGRWLLTSLYKLKIPTKRSVSFERLWGSIVCHVAGSSTKFGIRLNDLIYSFQEIFLSSNFSPCSNCKHTSFCTDTSNLSSYKQTKKK
jgi:hypothetical protein